jgi:hypothetical protein
LAVFCKLAACAVVALPDASKSVAAWVEAVPRPLIWVLGITGSWLVERMPVMSAAGTEAAGTDAEMLRPSVAHVTFVLPVGAVGVVEDKLAILGVL